MVKFSLLHLFFKNEQIDIQMLIFQLISPKITFGAKFFLNQTLFERSEPKLSLNIPKKKSKALKLTESNELFQESINSVPSQNFSQMDHMELIMPTLQSNYLSQF